MNEKESIALFKKVVTFAVGNGWMIYNKNGSGNVKMYYLTFNKMIVWVKKPFCPEISHDFYTLSQDYYFLKAFFGESVIGYVIEPNLPFQKPIDSIIKKYFLGWVYHSMQLALVQNKGAYFKEYIDNLDLIKAKTSKV